MNQYKTVFSYFVRGAKHAAMCQASIDSIRRIDMFSRVVVVTDEEKRNWSVTADEIMHIPPGMPIMLANVEAQVQVLMRFHHGDTRVIFLDTDTLLLRPFTTQADILVTWRDAIGEVDGEKVEGVAGRMPYNYGVIVARANPAAIETFIWLRERVRKMHSGHKQWYGNQLALFEICGQRPTEGTTIDARRIPWTLTQYGNTVNIEKAPCDTHNWTPARIGEPLDGKYVAHFKGHSRALMESYAKRLGLQWSEAA